MHKYMSRFASGSSVCSFASFSFSVIEAISIVTRLTPRAKAMSRLSTWGREPGTTRMPQSYAHIISSNDRRKRRWPGEREMRSDQREASGLGAPSPQPYRAKSTVPRAITWRGKIDEDVEHAVGPSFVVGWASVQAVPEHAFKQPCAT